MGKKSSGSAPAIDPAVGQALQKQNELLEQQQQWYQDEIYPWMKNQAGLQNENAKWDRDVAYQNYQFWQNLAKEQYDKQNERSDEQYNRWKTVFKPMEDSLVQDAERYNTSAEAERQAALAIGDVATQAANARQAQNMQMQAYGINPTAGAYQAQNRAMQFQQAGLQASAANQARQAAEALGWQKRAQVAALGQNYINNANAATQLGNQGASTYGGQASNALGQAAGYGQVGLNNIGQVANVGLNSYNSLQNGWGQYGQLGLGASNYNLNAWNAQTQNQTNRHNSWWNNLNTASNILDKWVGNDAMYKQSASFSNIMGGIGKF